MPASYRYVDKDGLYYFKGKIVALIPTNTNQLQNGAGFITKAVDDLTNYYNATYMGSHYYDKNYIDGQLAQLAGQLTINVVSKDTWLSTYEQHPDTYYGTGIYLVPQNGGQSAGEHDVCYEYISARQGTQGNYTYSWERLGDTNPNLSGYVPTSRRINNKTLTSNITLVAADIDDVYSKTECDNKFVVQVAGKGLSQNDFTGTLKSKLDGIEENAEVNDIITVKVNNVALTPDSNRAVNVTVPTNNNQLTNGAGYLAGSDWEAVSNQEIDGMF